MFLRLCRILEQALILCTNSQTDYTKGLDKCIGRLQSRLEVGNSAFHLLGTETEVGGGGCGLLLEEGGARVLNKVLYKEALPRDPTLFVFI